MNQCIGADIPRPSSVVVVVEYWHKSDYGFDYDNDYDNDNDNERSKDFRSGALGTRPARGGSFKRSSLHAAQIPARRPWLVHANASLTNLTPMTERELALINARHGERNSQDCAAEMAFQVALNAVPGDSTATLEGVLDQALDASGLKSAFPRSRLKSAHPGGGHRSRRTRRD